MNHQSPPRRADWPRLAKAWPDPSGVDLALDRFLAEVERNAKGVGHDAPTFFGRIAAGLQEPKLIQPFIFEHAGIRGLLARWGFVQSAMILRDPVRLVLDYTQAMMGFLLFTPEPNSLEIIGLGGGSLAKYCHRFLPDITIRAVEIDRDVVALAPNFCVPPEDDRFEIIWDDGAAFIRSDARKTDVLLIDVSNGFETPAQLVSDDFYRACRSRLRPGGILVVNLCNRPGKNLPILMRMCDLFDEVITVPAEDGMNLVVIARKDFPLLRSRKKLLERGYRLQKCHPLPFASIAARVGT